MCVPVLRLGHSQLVLTGRWFEQIASARDLEDEFARMMPPFEGKETEHNWAAREASMDKVRGMLLGGAFTRYPHEFVACLRASWLEASLKAVGPLPSRWVLIGSR